MGRTLLPCHRPGTSREEAQCTWPQPPSFPKPSFRRGRPHWSPHCLPAWGRPGVDCELWGDGLRLGTQTSGRAMAPNLPPFPAGPGGPSRAGVPERRELSRGGGCEVHPQAQPWEDREDLEQLRKVRGWGSPAGSRPPDPGGDRCVSLQAVECVVLCQHSPRTLM